MHHVPYVTVSCITYERIMCDRGQDHKSCLIHDRIKHRVSFMTVTCIMYDTQLKTFSFRICGRMDKEFEDATLGIYLFQLFT